MPTKTKTLTKPKSTTKKVVKKAAVKKTAKKAVKKTTKKVATKAVTKKVAKKVTASKKVAKKASGKKLVYATEETCFWTTDGQIFSDLVTLKDALKQMPKAVFQHHVTKDKNDFADWVQHVLEDEACATDLRTRKTPSAAHTVIVTHLKSYKL